MERKHKYLNKQFPVYCIKNKIIDSIEYFYNSHDNLIIESDNEVYYLYLNENNLRSRDLLLEDINKLSIGDRCDLYIVKIKCFNCIVDININNLSIDDIININTNKLLTIVNNTTQNIINIIRTFIEDYELLLNSDTHIKIDK